VKFKKIKSDVFCAVWFSFFLSFSLFCFMERSAERFLNSLHVHWTWRLFLLLLSLFIQKQPLRMIEQSTWASRKERRRSLLTRNRQKFFDFQEEKHTLPLQPPTTTITTTTKKKFLYIFCFVLFHPSFLFEKKRKNSALVDHLGRFFSTQREIS
jgi:hypothetical protein